MQNTIKLQGREAATFAVMTNSYVDFDGREIPSSMVKQILEHGKIKRLGVDCKNDEQHREALDRVSLEVELKTLDGSTEVEGSGAWAVAVLLVPQEGMSLDVFVEGSPLSTAPILVGQRRDDAVKLKAECPNLVAAVLELGRQQANADRAQRWAD
jgi:hypothetical protein